jgi:hypothetical protein
VKKAMWRGVVALVGDAVEHGSRAIERVHLETAKRPFVILEHIPVVAPVARVVHVAHDATAMTVYGTIRVVNAGIGAVVRATEPTEAPEPTDAPEPTEPPAGSE